MTDKERDEIVRIVRRAFYSPYGLGGTPYTGRERALYTICHAIIKQILLLPVEMGHGEQDMISAPGDCLGLKGG